jgi:Protein of unknown function (DUF3237)
VSEQIRSNNTGPEPGRERLAVGKGERLRANIVGPGADWAMPGPGGAMLLDVRQIIETDDGAVIVYEVYEVR